MTRITLEGGFYEARSVIADAQRCINLYPEINPNTSQVPVTHYPTPGKRLLGTATNNNACRCLYTASNGVLFGAFGDKVYAIDSAWTFTAYGTLTTTAGPVSMYDNGTTLIVVDGSIAGFKTSISNNTWTQITDAGFYGADVVKFMDGYFILNKPGTRQWFISDIQAPTFTQALNFASKEANSDILQTVAVVHREVWLIGKETCEVYYDSGDVNFPFARMPGVFVQHGCAAKHSVATWDLSLFWVGQDPQGQFVCFRVANYQANRVSTHAIEEVWSQYSDVSDAVGFCYQQEGHPFYVVSFPTANATWVYDISSGKWHERAYLEADGSLSRDRANCHAVAYGQSVVGDWENGNLYALDPAAYDDNGSPIKRIRSFPTIDLEDRRVIYRRFTADMQVGVGLTSGDYADPQVNLRWSDDGGRTWGQKIEIPLGKIGEYNHRAVANRLGYGRMRVFELSWAAPVSTALNGAWLQYEVCRS